MGYQFIFILLLSFLTNQKQESRFQQVGGLVTRNIFIYSESHSILQNHTEFNRISWRNFFTCYSCSYSFMDKHRWLVMFAIIIKTIKRCKDSNHIEYHTWKALFNLIGLNLIRFIEKSEPVRLWKNLIWKIGLYRKHQIFQCCTVTFVEFNKWYQINPLSARVALI